MEVEVKGDFHLSFTFFKRIRLKTIITQRTSQGHFFVTAGPPSLSPEVELNSSFGDFSAPPQRPILAWLGVSLCHNPLCDPLFQHVPCSSPGLKETQFPPPSFCAPRTPRGPGLSSSQPGQAQGQPLVNPRAVFQSHCTELDSWVVRKVHRTASPHPTR